MTLQKPQQLPHKQFFRAAPGLPKARPTPAQLAGRHKAAPFLRSRPSKATFWQALLRALGAFTD